MIAIPERFELLFARGQPTRIPGQDERLDVVDNVESQPFRLPRLDGEETREEERATEVELEAKWLPGPLDATDEETDEENEPIDAEAETERVSEPTERVPRAPDLLFDEAEMAHIAASAAARARAAALEEARAGLEAQRNERLERAAIALERALESMRSARARFDRDFALAATRAASLMVDALWSHEPPPAFERALGEALEALSGEPWVEIDIGEEIDPLLARRLRERASRLGLADRVSVSTGHRAAPREVEARWPDGSLRFDRAQLEDAIGAAVEAACARTEADLAEAEAEAEAEAGRAAGDEDETQGAIDGG